MKDKSPHKNLKAWQLAMDIVVDVYSLTKTFPETEKYGLVSQMTRAAVSVPSNIAEGAADRTTKEFANYLSIALGSLAELDTQIEISFRINFIAVNDQKDLQEKINLCKALVIGLKKSLQT